MKSLLGVCFMAILAMAVTSCKEKKTDTIIITKKKPAAAQAPKVLKMGDYTQSQTTTWMGSKYTIETQLAADDSLPLASDGTSRYYDNRITLRVIRADGSVFLKKSFTKSYFKSYVDDIYYKNGALLGIVFVNAKGNYLNFAASVGNPDKSSDEYVPLVLKVDNFGNVTISKDTQLDTDEDMADDAEDGV